METLFNLFRKKPTAETELAVIKQYLKDNYGCNRFASASSRYEEKYLKPHGIGLGSMASVIIGLLERANYR